MADNPREGLRREYFVFFTSWLEGVEGFPDEMQVEVLLSLMRYCAYGKKPDLTKPHVKLAFTYAKETIDRSIQNYLNGKQPKRNKSESEANDKRMTSESEANDKRSYTIHNNTSQQNTSEETSEKKEKEKKEKFLPPTLDEIREAMAEKGYTNFTAEEFFGYYDSQGWKKANGLPIVRWKGCLATFAHSQYNGKQQNHTAKPFDPGHFDGEDDEHAYDNEAENWK